MAYTIIKSDGTVLTTVPDGTINTTSTSLGLPGRNYAGWGLAYDTNFVHQLENYADSTPPPNPLRGQLWFNTNNETLCVCPLDGETNPDNWYVLTSVSSGGSTTFGNVTVTGDIEANNITAISSLTASNSNFVNITVSGTADINNGNITNGTVGTLTTQSITTGAPSTSGTLTGTWTLNGTNGLNGNALILNAGGIFVNPTGNLYGIRCDNYMYANGDPIPIGGTYSNTNVAQYLPNYGGNILLTQAQATVLTTGAAGTAGSITGNWSLTPGSNLTTPILTVTGNGNVGNLGVSGLITTVGNVTGGNLTTTGRTQSGLLTVTGNGNLGNVGATNGVFTGTVSGQTLSVSGNGNLGNVGATTGVFTTVNASGNISANNFVVASNGKVTTGATNVNGIFEGVWTFNNGSLVRVDTTTVSTSTSTGALVVSGGVGVGGNIYAGAYYGSGTGLTNLPGANVTGIVAVTNGGTGASTQSGARTNLGATTVGTNLFTLTNPSAITFLRVNSDNTVSALDATNFRTAIGAGTGVGNVTSVSGTGTVNGLTLSGTVTGSGSLTLGGSLSNVNLTSQVTGTLPIANGGTGQTTATNALNALLPSQATNANKVLTTDGTNTSWQDPFTKLETVTPLPLPPATLVTTTNTFGVMPTIYTVSLRCTTPEFGYLVGDEIAFSAYDSPGFSLVSPWVNATTLGLAMAGTAAAIRIAYKNGSTFSPLTPANWSVVFRAIK
jgi:hypothetical protein